MSDETKSTPKKDYIDVRVRLTIQQIDKLETLREKWGFRKRSTVLERLLEVVLEEDKESPKS